MGKFSGKLFHVYRMGPNKVSAANVRVYKVNLIDGDEEEEAVECQGWS